MALNKNAKAWVRALRSGRYKQGKAYLHARGGKYCCLGVACDLYKQQVLKTTKNPEYLKVNEGITLPAEVQEWLGLSHHEGEFFDASEHDTKYLTGLNDKGTSFKEIAKVIASEPEGLFVE
jgi:hypothetical protein